MSRAQQYITSLLDNIPLDELSDLDHRVMFQKIRERLSNTTNLEGELQTLYKVENFSELALRLLWIAGRVEREPSMLESTPEEQTQVFSSFQSAIGGGEVLQAQAEVPAPEPEAVSPSVPETATVTALPSGSEQEFASLVERFVEAVQSGTDERTNLQNQLREICSNVIAQGEGAAEDYKKFCGVLSEFITYISDNQLMDDIRVMNLLSNITDPVLQWSKADPGSRVGMLEAGVEVLRDFKSLFE